MRLRGKQIQTLTARYNFTPKLLILIREAIRSERCYPLSAQALGVLLLWQPALSVKAADADSLPHLNYPEFVYSYKSRCEEDVQIPMCTDLKHCDLLDRYRPPKEGWMDSSHEFVTTKADALAGWMDGFFGTQRADDEAAQSFLRLRFQHEWDEEEGHDIKKPTLRGKVKLPRLDKRLGLIFSEDGRDDDSVNEKADNLLENENPNNEVALQYTGVDKGRSRLDFNVSLPSFKFKSRIRYRYKYPFSEKYAGRFTEELIFKDGDGFRAVTRLELDNILNENLLLRWSNRVRYGEKTEGMEWSSSVGLAQRIDDQQAISYFVSVNGKTDPEFISEREAERLPGEPLTTDQSPGWLTEAYGVGVLYRVNFFRRWLFVEIQPAVLWRRSYELEDSRKPVGVITARLEIMFDADHTD